MTAFSGRLALAQDRASELSVEISLDDERIRITAGSNVIGDWGFEEVEIFNFGDGLHLFVEGEEIVVSSDEPEFAAAMLEPAIARLGSTPPARTARLSESVQRERNHRRRGVHEAGTG